MEIRINIANLEVRFDTNADETGSIEYMATVHPAHIDEGMDEIADEFTNEHLGINVAELDEDDDPNDPNLHTCPSLVWDSARREVEQQIHEHVARLKALKGHRPRLGC